MRGALNLIWLVPPLPALNYNGMIISSGVKRLLFILGFPTVLPFQQWCAKMTLWHWVLLCVLALVRSTATLGSGGSSLDDWERERAREWERARGQTRHLLLLVVQLAEVQCFPVSYSVEATSCWLTRWKRLCLGGPRICVYVSTCSPSFCVRVRLGFSLRSGMGFKFKCVRDVCASDTTERTALGRLGKLTAAPRSTGLHVTSNYHSSVDPN